jgi:Flp pilus assembly protein TadB
MQPLFQSTIGWVLLGGGIFSELIGIILIKKVVSIDL